MFAHPQRQRRHARDDEEAVSPVVGTILMVAVTVLMGATVYTAVNGFGGESTSPPPATAFKLQRLDADADGRYDRFKVTYLAGPDGVADTDVVVSASPDAGTPTGSRAATDPWSPGDFMVYDPAAADTYFVTVSALGVVVVDQSVTLDE